MMGPHEVNEAMEGEIGRLDDLLEQVKEAGQTHASRDRDFKVAWAEARIAYRGSHDKYTVDQVNDYATLQTQDALQAATSAEERLKYDNSARRASETRIDALRSISASIREAGG
jgi:hypothetical protein